MKKIIYRMVAGMLKGKKYLSCLSRGAIDLSAIFPSNIEEIINGSRIDSDFRACRSNDEYNREVVEYFKYHRESFYLDKVNSDGHFRV